MQECELFHNNGIFADNSVGGPAPKPRLPPPTVDSDNSIVIAGNLLGNQHNLLRVIYEFRVNSRRNKDHCKEVNMIPVGDNIAILLDKDGIESIEGIIIINDSYLGSKL